METKNKAGLDYWEEKELELAMNILPKALGWNDRVSTFDPVSFSLDIAKDFIYKFRLNHDLL